MRFAIAVALTFSMSATSVLAADMYEPIEGGFIESSVYDWSGFYAGLHAGYGHGSAEGEFDSGGTPGGPYDLSDFDLGGGLFGAHAGYNWQRDSIVYGIEADVSGAWLHDTLSGSGAAPGETIEIGTQLHLLASLRARVGYAWDNFLFYGTAGVGYASYEFTSQFDTLTPPLGSISAHGWGGVFGAGLEYGRDNWAFRLEGLHYAVQPEHSFSDGEVPDADDGDAIRWGGVSTIRAGVSYRF